MVKLRLKRFGTKKRPYYRIVVMDAKAPRDGRCIEELGFYRPVEAKDQVKIKETVLTKWLQRGALPTDTVRQILNRSGFNCGRN